MKVIVKLLSMASGPPPGFDEFGERAVDAATGATVADIMATISLPKEEAYTTIVNGEAVSIGVRTGYKLSDGDELTLFPAIQGG